MGNKEVRSSEKFLASNISKFSFERFSSLLIIDFKEVLYSRWFLFYFVVFGFVSVGLGWVGWREGIYGFSGVGKFLASFVNISFLLVPAFSLLPSSLSISSARENLILEYVFSFPIKKIEFFLSKFISIFSGIILPPILILPLFFFILKYDKGDFLLFFKIVFFLILFSFVFVSLGLLISVASLSRLRAISFALFFLFFFTVFSEVGVLSFISLARVPNFAFILFILLNPAETFRLAVISFFSQTLDVLGPFGLYIYYSFGEMMWIFFALSLFLMGAIFFFLAFALFSKQRP
jgi:Cu-processing system permease protein